jgi:hypothetical protein
MFNNERNGQMKKILLLAMMAMMFSLLGCGSSETPESTVTQWVDAVLAADYEAANALCDGFGMALATNVTINQAKDGSPRKEEVRAFLTGLKDLRSEVEGDTAKVYCPARPDKPIFELKKVDGKWKIVGEGI